MERREDRRERGREASGVWEGGGAKGGSEPGRGGREGGRKGRREGGRDGGTEGRREGGHAYLVVEDAQRDEVCALGKDRHAINLEVEREALRAWHWLLHQADRTNADILHLREGGREGGKEGSAGG